MLGVEVEAALETGCQRRAVERVEAHSVVNLQPVEEASDGHLVELVGEFFQLLELVEAVDGRGRVVLVAAISLREVLSDDLGGAAVVVCCVDGLLVLIVLEGDDVDEVDFKGVHGRVSQSVGGLLGPNAARRSSVCGELFVSRLRCLTSQWLSEPEG